MDGNSFAGGAIAIGGTGNDNYPAAYLNYLVFDSEYNLTGQEGYVGIPQSGPGAYTISAEDLIIEQAGYVYIYVSNESTSSQYVFFDNFDIAISESPILESSEYYPFGLTFNAYTKPGTTNQNYKYQSKEEQTELSTIDFNARMYDPALGRTWQLDPLLTKYYDLSPYSWVANNPLIIVDPTGMELDYSLLDKEEKKEFKQIFKELKKTGDTGKEVVKYLKSKESGRIELTANSGSFQGEFDANERITIDGKIENFTLDGFKSDEIGGRLNINFELIELYGVNPVDVLAEEAPHAALFTAEANKNGSNLDVDLLRGNDEFTAKAIVGQIEKESGRTITDFGNDGSAREFGRNAFSSKSTKGFQNALKKWQSEQTIKRYQRASTNNSIPVFFQRLISK